MNQLQMIIVILLIDISDDNNTALHKFKQKITNQTGNNGMKNVEMMVKVKYLSNFWRIFEIPLINCETWSANCFIMAGAFDNQVPIFVITDTKLHVLVVILSTRESSRLSEQLKSDFRRAINWNKFQSKAKYKHETNTYIT